MAAAAASRPPAPVARSRASENRSSKPHALVLGWKGSAELIARSLGAEGFTTVLEAELPPGARMPRLSQLDQARAVLKKFAAAHATQASELYLHPGVSPWAESPSLQAIGQEAGFEVISPSARALTFFGNRLNLITEAEKSGIANLVVSFEPVHSTREIQQLIKSKKVRFPLLLKSVQGGGSGRFLIREEEDLERRLELWMEQVRRSVGEVMLFAERYVEGARYVVQPFARMPSGHFEAFPSYDASLQSRYRKILSFCPCESIDSSIASKIVEWTERLAKQSGYVGVGALEFMVDGARPYLVEGTARLDTGFRLWERVAGTSAVSWQLAALAQATATGRGTAQSLPKREPPEDFAAGIALRIQAEDSLLQLPQPGRVHEVPEKTEWSFPSSSAELTLGVKPDDEISPEDSGLIAILWVGGRDATQAQTVARGVLDELWFSGSLQTNQRFLSELLNHPWVRAGLFHAGFVEEEFLPAIRPPQDILRVLAALGPLVAQGKTTHGERWSVGDQWVRPPAQIEGWTEGPEFTPIAGSTALSGRIRLPDGRTHRVSAFPLGPDRWLGRVGHWSLALRRVLKPGNQPRVMALVSGRVHSVLFREGSQIPPHEPFLVIESLGMLVPHALPREIRVNKWKVSAEDLVLAGEDLADFDVLSEP